MRSIILIWLLLLSALGCAQREPPQSAAPPPAPREIVATVIFVKGQADLFFADAWQPVTLGQELAADDSLVLAEWAELEIRSHDGRTARLAGPWRNTVSGSLEQAAKAKSTAVGVAAAKIKKLEGSKQKFETKTPTAVAGVRGAPVRAAPDSAKKDSIPQE